MPRRQSNVAEGGRGRGSRALSVRNVAEGGSRRGRGRRGRSTRMPGGGASAVYSLPDLPPGLAESVAPALGVWPALQSTRDCYVEMTAQVMDRPSGYTDRFLAAGVLDPGLARRAAAAFEAEAFAHACDSAARTSLDSAMNRFNVFRLYVRLLGSRLTDFGKSYAADPDAAFDALGLGVAWREWKTKTSSSSATALMLLPPPAAPASEAAGASSAAATAPPPAAAPPSESDK